MDVHQHAIIATWLKTALSEFKPIDRERLNGGASDPATVQLLKGLEDAYAAAGQPAVARVWEAVKVDYPEVQAWMTRKRKLYSGAELAQMEPLEFLIQDRLIVSGMHCIYGDSNVGKSVWALEAAERVAAMGEQVVYIMGEGAHGYVARHRTWKAVRGKDTDEFIFFWNGPVLMTDSSARAEFDGDLVAMGIRPALIVVDTLSTCYTGDENSSSEMMAFLRSFMPYQRDGTAILLVHHSNRADTGPRGSGALYAYCDVMFYMRNDDGHIVIESEKFKDNPYIPPAKRVLIPHTYDGYSSVTLEDAAQYPPQGLTPLQRTILEKLSTRTFDAGIRMADLKAITGLSSATLYAAIEHLLKAGLLSKDGKYDPFSLTSKGRAEAKRLGYDVPTPMHYPAGAIDVSF